MSDESKIDLSSTLYPHERAALLSQGKDPSDYTSIDLQSKPTNLAMDPSTGAVVFFLEAVTPPGVFEGFTRTLLLGPDGQPKMPDLGRSIVMMPQTRFVIETKALTSSAKDAALKSLELQRGGSPK
jgi:hypothetical protein